MNQDKTDLSKAHAEDARELLKHPALLRAFDRLEQKYHTEWLSSKAADVSALQDLKYRQDALTAFRNDLEATIAGGRIAEHNSGVSRTPTLRTSLNRNV